MNRGPNVSIRRPRSWWLWVGAWGVLAVIMHVPPSELTRRIGRADWAAHFAAYFILASLGARHLRRSKGGVDVTALAGWAAVYFAYAAADEWLQRFVSRTPSYTDWLADVAGVLVATGVAIAWDRWLRERLSEPPVKKNVTRS